MKTKLVNAVVLAAVSSMWAVGANAQQVKIGYVDLQQVVREASLGKAAQMKLDAEFGKRSKDLQDLDAKVRGVAEKLDKDVATLSEVDRIRRGREITDQKRELDRKTREFQEDVDRRRVEENAALGVRINAVLKQIFDGEHYDLIMQDSNAIYGQRVDITKKVIDMLNAQK